MKVILGLHCFIVSLFFVFLARPVGAQTNYLPETVLVPPSLPLLQSASPSVRLPDGQVEATLSAQEATPSSMVEKVIEKKSDITEPTPEVKGKLERYLMEQKIEPLSWNNFLQHFIRQTVKQGVPANTIVLVLLLPLVAALIASARHIIGLRGFGIFTPAMVAVAFLATGIVAGLLLFATILLMGSFSRIILRKLHLQYLPRMALLLWFICLGVLAILAVSPLIAQPNLTAMTIFPILLMILLAENFIELQAGGNMREAIKITTETLLIALICYFVMSLEELQKFVLLKPELTVFGVAIYNLFIGKYVGLRLMEYWRFRQIIKNG